MRAFTLRFLTASAAAVLLSGAALAADLPMSEPPMMDEEMAPAAAFSWTGFEVGLQGGYAWGNSNATFSNGAPALSYDPEGIVGGGFWGANYQWNVLVLGVEGDFETTDINGSARSAAGLTSQGRINVNRQASVRGRVGAAFDRILAYATGGAAYANVDVTGGPLGGPFGNYNDSDWGWTVGAGVDYAVTNHFIAGIEYRYTDFGSFSGTLAPPFPGVSEPVDLQTHAIRGRVGVKF